MEQNTQDFSAQQTAGARSALKSCQMCWMCFPVICIFEVLLKNYISIMWLIFVFNQLTNSERKTETTIHFYPLHKKISSLLYYIVFSISGPLPVWQSCEFTLEHTVKEFLKAAGDAFRLWTTDIREVFFSSLSGLYVTAIQLGTNSPDWMPSCWLNMRTKTGQLLQIWNQFALTI